MADDEPIVREIYIDASPEETFPYLTESDKYRLWMGLSAELDARPGGIFRVMIAWRRIRYACSGISDERSIRASAGSGGLACFMAPDCRFALCRRARTEGDSIAVMVRSTPVKLVDAPAPNTSILDKDRRRASA